ncbi:MAG TPA: hypothetical protein DEB73_01045 [Candidatus Magasanikbacteria bacterium]|uniref:Peptidase S74 domain-containing protein n=2 Tax=Candidatus Magasanikiibacteriota TaxID=1752731 RepID=A0A0G1A6D6_9BACT|nr:MAG: hypothetical protein UU49_C0003G0023 [Candidatus Magasanikbacteria bacterium GW2011_GWC2_41_17]KKS56504.1 MAG: hypothetical protein UV20_C0010G0007 [Candidatus Magasanikbacteria bacterium GW2011_GWA2_42_32]HBV57842.1 hypothetical protein [Candidatus Magasanikbacteria bacterium]HBX15767.1 hypothetical protein [Candidatus Magasanikbacteria bacterium]
MGDKNFKSSIIKVGVFLILFAVFFFSSYAPARAGFFDQANSYLSEGGKTLGEATDQIGTNAVKVLQDIGSGLGETSSQLGGSALEVWQKVGDGLGEAVGMVVKNTSQASGAFLGGIKNFGQTVGDLGNQVSKGYDATLGKVKQGTDKAAETVINILPKKNNAKVVVPKPTAKKDTQKLEVKENVVASAPIAVQSEKNKKAPAPAASKEIIIYSNKANQESIQPFVAAIAKASSVSGGSIFETIKSNGNVSVGDDAVIDAATGIATLKGIKIIGTVDFTGAEVKGFKQTVVNNYSSGGSSPLVVYNSSSGNYETRTSISGNYGGVSEQFSVGKDLTVGQNATVASVLTIGTASSNGSLTVNGTAAITGATTFSGVATLNSDLTVNGNTTLGDAVGDTITVNGRLSTLNISDGSTTSSLAKNSFYIAADSSNALGKFYVDSSGNVSASGTITSSGGISMSGHLNPASDNLYDVGSSSTQWRYGNFQSGLLVADGSTTSTLLNNSLTLGQANNYNQGYFNVDSSGNTSASGSLRTFGNVTSTGIIYASGGLISSASSTFSNSLNTDSLNVVNNIRASSTLLVGTAAGTDNLFVNGNNTYVATSTAAGTSYSLAVGNGTTGAIIAGGHISPSHTGLFDFGTQSLFWRNGYFGTGLNVSAGNVTSTLTQNSLTVGQASNYNQGYFYVDGANGNVNTSGSLQSAGGLLTLTGGTAITAGSYQMGRDADATNQMHFNVPTGAAYEWSVNDTAVGTLGTTGIFTGASFNITGSATYGANALVDTIREYGSSNGLRLRGNMADGATSYGVKLGATTALNTTGAKIVGFYNDNFSSVGERAYIDLNGGATFAVSSTLGYADGRFKIDNSGNVSASGSLRTFGNVTSTGNLYALTGTASTSILNGSSLTLGQGTAYNSGMFNVDSNGNVSASGTLNIVGAVNFTGVAVTTTIAGGLVVDTNTLVVDYSQDRVGIGTIPVGSNKLSVAGNIYLTAGSQLDWQSGNVRILESANNLIFKTWNGAASTEVARITSGGGLALGVATNFNQGYLFADSLNGNVSASGSLRTFGNVTSTGNLYALSGTASTSILNGSSLTLGQGTGSYNSGMFNVDSNGNVSASGSLRSAGGLLTLIGGTAITAGSYQMGRDVDATNQLHFNVPTGASFEFSANDSPVATLASTGAFKTYTISELGGDTSLGLLGNANDGAAAVGLKIGNMSNLTIAGAKIISFYTGAAAFTTERAYISASGMPVFGINTGYNEGLFKIDNSGNVSASGTLAFTNTSGGTVSSTVGNLILSASNSTNDAAIKFLSGIGGTSEIMRVSAGLGASGLMLGVMPTGPEPRGVGSFYVNDMTGNIATSGTIIQAPLATNIVGNAVCITSNNQLTNAGSSACNPSALKFKTDVQDLSLDTATNIIMALKPITFTDISPVSENDKHFGFIADWSKDIDRRLVDLKDGEPWSFEYMNYTAVLTKVIQEQQKRLEELEQLTVSENNDGTLSGNLSVDSKTLSGILAVNTSDNLWYIDETGLLVAKDIKADSVQAKKFVVKKKTDAKQTSVGEATILNNSTLILVENELVTSTSKIFITFRSNPNAFWWISKQDEGMFEVALSKPAEGDLTFDYWIIGVEDASVLETESVPAAAIAPVETAMEPVQAVEPAPITPVVPEEPSSSSTVEAPVAPIEPMSEVIAPVVESASAEPASVSNDASNP